MRSGGSTGAVEACEKMRATGARIRRSIAASVLCLPLVACGSGAGAPTMPSPPPDRSSYIGTWSGTITDEALGEGTLTLVIEMQFETPSGPLLGGNSTRTFPDARFNGTVHVTGIGLGSGELGLLFGPLIVPCAGEPGGTAERTLSAVLTVSGTTMQGTYGAPACSAGGTMRLMRKS